MTESDILKAAIDLVDASHEKSVHDPSKDLLLQFSIHLKAKLEEIDVSKVPKTLEEVLLALEDPIPENESGYELSKRSASILPGISLGQEINTPLGKGIVINLSMPSNGLYLSPEKAQVTVWFSSAESKSGWVLCSYMYNELKGFI